MKMIIFFHVRNVVVSQTEILNRLNLKINYSHIRHQLRLLLLINIQ